MKKYYLLALAAFTSMATMAVPYSMLEKQVLESNHASQALQQLEFKQKEVKLMSPIEHPEDSGIVTKPPVGITKYYNTIGDCYTIWLLPIAEKANHAGQIVFTDNNEVWIKNILTSYNAPGWVKGQLSDDGKKITVQFPQRISVVHADEEDASILTKYPCAYVSVMNFSEEVNNFVPAPEEENFITYSLDDSGTFTLDGYDGFQYVYDPIKGKDVIANPDKMVSAYCPLRKVTTDGIEYIDNVWIFYANISQRFEPLTGVVTNEIPEDLSWSKWELVNKNDNVMLVDMAFDGNDVYMKGLSSHAMDAAVKGTIEGDKIVFPSKQFFGIDQGMNYFIIFFGGTVKWQYSEEHEGVVGVVTLQDNIEFAYDAEAKTLASGKETAMMFNAYLDKVGYFQDSYQDEPFIFKQTPESLCAAIPNPAFKYQVESSAGHVFAWDFSAVNENQMLVDADFIYYNVYVNGEKFTFYTDEYPQLTEDITDVPYNFCDDSDSPCIYVEGEEHDFVLNGDGIETVGVKEYYTAPDGKVYPTARVTYDTITQKVEVEVDGITSANVDREPVRVNYTNMQGMKVATPTEGNIYLRTITFSDGSRQVSKMIAR